MSNPDRANVLLPYVLIPQIILGGGILTINEEPLETLAKGLSPAYGAYRAIHRGVAQLPETGRPKPSVRGEVTAVSIAERRRLWMVRRAWRSGVRRVGAARVSSPTDRPDCRVWRIQDPGSPSTDRASPQRTRR